MFEKGPQTHRCLIKIILYWFIGLSSANSIYLEQIDTNKFINKKIAYYPGSFDPLHLGHITVVKTLLDQNLADYVLIYALPESDHKKNRTPISLRQKMLESIFKEHPRVLITKLNPAKMQEKFQPLFNHIQFSVVQGSDVIREYIHNTKYDALWMRGIPIKTYMPQHANTSLGAIAAIPATEVIAFNREGDNLSPIGNCYKNRPLIIVQTPTYAHLSSTKARNISKTGEDISEIVPPEVLQIIQDNNLYMS